VILHLCLLVPYLASCSDALSLMQHAEFVASRYLEWFLIRD
jgi:hypothetical protein